MNHTQRRILFTAAVLLYTCCTSYAIEAQDDNYLEPAPTLFPTYLATMPVSSSPSLSLTSAPSFTSNLNGFDIVIVPGPTLALPANAAALTAFNKAAAQWEARIASPITVTINADLASLGPGILGSASSTMFTGGYSLIRNAVAAQATSEPVDDAITGFLPTSGGFTATLPSGFTLSGNLLATRANLSALGFTGLPGSSDAQITFSTNFNFDYDNTNGVTAGQYDFESVAAHEIGHALGFVSSVDDVDYLLSQSQTGAIDPTTLDLFRFLDGNSSVDPIDAATFLANPRNLVPGAVANTDFGTNLWGNGSEFLMSTGSSFGDGRQASHWKDNLNIGLMDPTLAPGVIVPLSEADFRAIDLIGYNIVPIPEPSTYALGMTGLAAIYWMRRRRAA